METSQVTNNDARNLKREPTILEMADEEASSVQLTASHDLENAGPTRQEPGCIVGNRYLLQRRIGRGDLGEIYEAIDQHLSKARQQSYFVAIELVTLDRDQTQISERLAGEFVDLLSVSHPNIATIMDFGIDGATSFFTRELLEGASLRTILDSEPAGPLTEKEVLAVIRSVAEALRHVHAQGIVHGNLRAESIFVTCQYNVMLVDLASVILARAKQDSAGSLLGGPASLDVSDDVFGLACVAYELLSAEKPFGGAHTYEAFLAPRRPRRINDLPRYRWKALLRALERQSAERTPTVAEFAADFGVTGTETLIPSEPDKKPGRRGFVGPVLWLTATVGVIALIQPNFTTLSEWLESWQLGSDGRQNSILSQEGGSERLVSVQIGPVIVEDPTGTRGNLPLSELPDDTTSSANVAVEGELQTQVPAPSVAAVVQAPQAALTPSASAAVAVEAQSPVTPDSHANQISTAIMDSHVDTAPLGFAFAQEAVTVSEGDVMASFIMQRLGGAGGEASITWWTRDNTAIANDDYADLGMRTETFSAGQESLTVHLPLVSDSLIEERESFFVYLSWDSAPTGLIEELEIVVTDDDF